MLDGRASFCTWAFAMLFDKVGHEGGCGVANCGYVRVLQERFTTASSDEVGSWNMGFKQLSKGTKHIALRVKADAQYAPKADVAHFAAATTC